MGIQARLPEKTRGVKVEARVKMIYFALDTIKGVKSLAEIKIKWTKLSNKKYCPRALQ